MDFFGGKRTAALQAPLLEDVEVGAKSAPKRIPVEERVKRYIDAAATADKVNPTVASCLRAAEPALSLLLRGLMLVVPLYTWLYKRAYELYIAAPTNVLQVVFGAALCFFGGTFVVSLAAIEAFRLMGWQRVMADVHVIIEQASLVHSANSKDDLRDDDGDGVADVDQIPSAALAQRKLTLVRRCGTQPPTPLPPSLPSPNPRHTSSPSRPLVPRRSCRAPRSALGSTESPDLHPRRAARRRR